MTLVLPTPRLALCLALVAVVVAVSPLAGLALAFALSATIVADVALGPRTNPIDVRRLLPERLPHLVATEVTYVLSSNATTWLTVRAVEYHDGRVAIHPEPLVVSVEPQSSVRVTTDWTGLVRGDLDVARISIAMRNAIGLIERRYNVGMPASVAVVPPHGIAQRVALSARNRLIASGLRRIQRPGSGTEFERLRSYVPGDSFRKVSWKATARRGQLTIAEEHAERSQHIVIALDCGRLMSGRIDQRSKFDYALDACLALARTCMLAGDAVGLCAFADRELFWLSPSTKPDQFARILESTYALQPIQRESDYARAATDLRKRVSKRALFVLFSDIFDPDDVEEAVGAFQLLSGQHVVIVALMNDAAFETGAALQPHDRAEALEAGVALALLDERRHAITRLRTKRLDVIDVAPDKLAALTIESYLTIKSTNRL